jgi:hypothetical protein
MTNTVNVNIAIYGSLARLHGGHHVVQLNKQLEPGTFLSSLLAELGIPVDKKGFVFINAILCDMPGLNTESDRPMQDGDHVGIFSSDYIWPYQYRDGVVMSENLKRALQEQNPLHHSFTGEVSNNS